MPVRFIKTVREGIRINHADRIAEPEETRQRLECLLIHLDFTQYICLVFFASEIICVVMVSFCTRPSEDVINASPEEQ